MALTVRERRLSSSAAPNNVTSVNYLNGRHRRPCGEIAGAAAVFSGMHMTVARWPRGHLQCCSAPRCRRSRSCLPFIVARCRDCCTRLWRAVAEMRGSGCEIGLSGGRGESIPYEYVNLYFVKFLACSLLDVANQSVSRDRPQSAAHRFADMCLVYKQRCRLQVA